jgi:phosphatidylserine synthase
MNIYLTTLVTINLLLIPLYFISLNKKSFYRIVKIICALVLSINFVINFEYVEILDLKASILKSNSLLYALILGVPAILIIIDDFNSGKSKN